MKTLSLLTAGVVLWSPAFCGSGAFPTEDSQRQNVEAEFPGPTGRAMALAAEILRRHIDPPTLQGMILGAARSIYAAGGHSTPADLSQHISAASTPAQLHEILVEVWRGATGGQKPTTKLEQVMVKGLLSSVPGRILMKSVKEHRVDESLAANRYVGTGILLTMDKGSKRPMMAKVIPGGPAAHVGALDRDIIERIGDLDTHRLPQKEIIDLLRGPEGTTVDVVLRQRGAPARKYTITRGVVPLETVTNLREFPTGFPWLNQVAFLRVKISASSVHELRKYESRLNSKRPHGLILDFRGHQGGDVHHPILLADALLEGGEIGRVNSRSGSRLYRANDDCIFRNLPLALLVDGQTSGPAEWLAAALQDNGRAVIMGSPTKGEGYTESAGPSVYPETVLLMSTGLLERADGTPILAPRHGRVPSAQGDGVKDSGRAADRVLPDHRLKDKGDALIKEAVKMLDSQSG